MDAIDENGKEENVKPEEKIMSSSILNSIKKLFGLSPEIKDFDQDILININGAIFVLTQVGVGPVDGYTVETEETTYEDFLGESISIANAVKMFLFYKTKISFDPPTNASVLECLKELAQETLVRIKYQVDDTPSSFEKEEG